MWMPALVGLVLVSQAIVANEQGKPSFSGIWVQTSDAPSKFGVVPVCGRRCSIAQQGDKLTILRDTGKQVIDLTGKPEVTRSTFGSYTSDMVTTANWEGSVLVVVEIFKAPTDKGPGLKTVARLSLKDSTMTISGTKEVFGDPIKYEITYERSR